MSDHTVFKYTLDFGIGPIFNVHMPVGAKLLHVGEQHRAIQLWAWVDNTAKLEKRTFALVGTGLSAPSPAEATHVGSVIAGAFVWHIFEKTPP